MVGAISVIGIVVAAWAEDGNGLASLAFCYRAGRVDRSCANGYDCGSHRRPDWQRR